MKVELLYKLVHVANVLDEKGEHQEADEIDHFIEAQMEDFEKGLGDFIKQKHVEKIEDSQERARGRERVKEESQPDWDLLSESVEEIVGRVEALKNYIPSLLFSFNDSKDIGTVRDLFKQDLNRINSDAESIVGEIEFVRDRFPDYLKV